MVRKLRTAEHVHGRTGLDGYALPEPSVALAPKHGVDFIVDTVMAAPEGEITLCTLGPLTNVAMALIRQPAIAGRLRQIVMMGGAYFAVGNITPTAEFNIYVDPQAADVGVPQRHSADSGAARPDPPGADHRDAAAGLPPPSATRTGAAVAGLLSFSERFDLQKYGGTGAPLHDPCVIAWLLRPELFQGRQINVSIETASELTMGMTVADWWRVTNRPRMLSSSARATPTASMPC